MPPRKNTPRRPSPRLFYRGERRYDWILTLLVTVLAGLALAFLWLFYSLQQDMIYEKDGLRVLSDDEWKELRRSQRDSAESALSFEPLDSVEIVVDKTDYSAVTTTAGTGLSALRARYLAAESMTPTALDSFVAGMGDFNAAVLELKPTSGLLSYSSGLALAYSYGVNGSLDLSAYASKLKENGVYLVAQLSGIVDTALATRYTTIALQNASTGGVYLNEGRGFLDPYSQETRNYLSGLMTELAGMGFDEVLFNGFWCPETDALRFSSSMTGSPDVQSAVSSLALFLREEGDRLSIKVSVTAENGTLRAGEEGGGLGQDLTVFFKAFDRVAYEDDYYGYNNASVPLEAALGGPSDTRIVAVGTGYVPNTASYIVK